MYRLQTRVVVLVHLLSVFALSYEAVRPLSPPNVRQNAWAQGDAEPLTPTAGNTVDLQPLEHAVYCPIRELHRPSSCIHYQFESTALLETFIVDGDAYTTRIDSGEGFVSEGIVLEGSYCIGLSCERVADMGDVQHWCLMLMNIDPAFVNTTVTFHDSVCSDEEEKGFLEENLVWILGISCLGLVIVAVTSCMACCCMMRRLRREGGDRGVDGKDAFHEPLLPMFPPPPGPLGPPGGEVFYPPPPQALLSQSYRHEPAFQAPLPISHVPPPPGLTPPGTSSGADRRIRFSESEKPPSKKAKSKIRFPI